MSQNNNNDTVAVFSGCVGDNLNRAFIRIRLDSNTSRDYIYELSVDGGNTWSVVSPYAPGIGMFIKDGKINASSSILYKEILDTTSTSASLAVAGGCLYKFTEPLTSLTLASVEDSPMATTIIFQAENTPTIINIPSSVSAVLRWDDGNGVPAPTANAWCAISIISRLGTWGSFALRNN